MKRLAATLRALYATRVHACVCPTTGETVLAIQATDERLQDLLRAAEQLELTHALGERAAQVMGLDATEPEHEPEPTAAAADSEGGEHD